MRFEDVMKAGEAAGVRGDDAQLVDFAARIVALYQNDARGNEWRGDEWREALSYVKQRLGEFTALLPAKTVQASDPEKLLATPDGVVALTNLVVTHCRDEAFDSLHVKVKLGDDSTVYAVSTRELQLLRASSLESFVSRVSGVIAENLWAIVRQEVPEVEETNLYAAERKNA